MDSLLKLPLLYHKGSGKLCFHFNLILRTFNPSPQFIQEPMNNPHESVQFLFLLVVVFSYYELAINI